MLEHHLFHLPSLEPRGAVLADVRVDGAAAARASACISTCPACGGGSRRRRSSPISHERDGEPPTVLMGDLNEWSTRGGCLRDFAADHDFAPCGRSFHARRPIASLDRIMVTPRPRDRRQRRPPHRRLAPRLRSSADLGGARRPESQRRSAASAARVQARFGSERRLRRRRSAALSARSPPALRRRRASGVVEPEPVATVEAVDHVHHLIFDAVGRRARRVPQRDDAERCARDRTGSASGSRAPRHDGRSTRWPA